MEGPRDLPSSAGGEQRGQAGTDRPDVPGHYLLRHAGQRRPQEYRLDRRPFEVRGDPCCRLFRGGVEQAPQGTGEALLTRPDGIDGRRRNVAGLRACELQR
jgi:hypothetical protein